MRQSWTGRALLAATALIGLATANEALAAATVTIDGSSTVYPVTEAVAEEFQKKKKGDVRVTVGISGTGGGFKKLCRGEIDIADASRPILKSEMEACKQANIAYVELPIAFDALAVVVSPQNKSLDKISIDDLKKIWVPEAQSKVTKWNQVNPAWPNEPLNLYGAGSDSGTFDYFTEAVTGKAKASRGDYTASEDDNVLVQGISGDKNALGYVPFAYVHENKGKLKTLAIEHKGKAVQPSMENVLAGSYQPLSRPLFIYVNTTAMATKPEVKEFVQFYLTEVKTLAQEVGYTPLPDKAYETVRARVAAGKTGTAFGGEPEVGLPIEDILKREPKA